MTANSAQVQTMVQPVPNERSHNVHLSSDDLDRLRELRAQRPARHASQFALTRGAVLADWVAETVGSWRFIIIQSRTRLPNKCEIELLHNKIDALREQEILKLTNIIERLSQHLAPDLVAAIEAEAPNKT
jgi:hypothetical protein